MITKRNSTNKKMFSTKQYFPVRSSVYVVFEEWFCNSWLWLLVNCWFNRIIQSFISDSFFFLLHSLVVIFLFLFLFLCRSCKRIKDGRKETRIPLNSNFIFRFTTILWWDMLSWTNRNSLVSQTSGWNILQSHFQGVISLKFVMCPEGVFIIGFC